MTITLHWWMVPALLAGIGIVFWWKAEHAGGGSLAGLGEMFMALAFFAMALAVCVGHWL